MTKRAVVIGSLHVDLIARADRLPREGESVTGGTFAMTPGGKAGNQAIQLARCNVETSLLSCVGDDAFGRMLIEAIGSEDVRTDLISIDAERATGASTVFATASDYSSIICPGAAGSLSVAHLEAAKGAIVAADVLVMQCELPITFVADAISWCHALGIPVVLNASPVSALDGIGIAFPWDVLDWVVVNKVEADALAAKSGLHHGDQTSVFAELRTKLRIRNLIVTLGPDGAIWFGEDRNCGCSAFLAEVVDTVGAGDAFLGTLIASITLGNSVEESLRRASAAGALAVSQTGAFAALPTSAQIDAFLNSHGQSGIRWSHRGG
ncbi:MAG TPA: ribokinase [Thermomicrobiales bacterium]|nr:ribokinase [Thermomicrobiales bacterium]